MVEFEGAEDTEGEIVGFNVFEGAEDTVGDQEGDTVGVAVGSGVGSSEGAEDSVGTSEGAEDTEGADDTVGSFDGAADSVGEFETVGAIVPNPAIFIDADFADLAVTCNFSAKSNLAILLLGVLADDTAPVAVDVAALCLLAWIFFVEVRVTTPIKANIPAPKR